MGARHPAEVLVGLRGAALALERLPTGTTPCNPSHPPGTINPTSRPQPAQIDPVTARENRGWHACKRIL